MDIEEALELVLNLAKDMVKLSPDSDNAERDDAINQVEDFIVNHFATE